MKCLPSVLRRACISLIALISLVTIPAFTMGQESAAGESSLTETDRAATDGTLTGLVLNGRGTRQAFFVDLYTCELYLPGRTRDEHQIISLHEPMVVRLKVHGTPPEQMPDDWYRLLREELTDRLFKRVQTRYQDLAQGDRVELVYQPGLGTRVLVNDRELLVDPGRYLMISVLEQWLGDEPVSETLKRQLLGVG